MNISSPVLVLSWIAAAIGGAASHNLARDTSSEQRTVSASYYLSLADAVTAREAYRRVVSQGGHDDFCIAPTDDGHWAGYLCNPLEKE